jgi:hypothetical protein
MADATGFFVQVPHPGGEHNPPGDDTLESPDPRSR